MTMRSASATSLRSSSHRCSAVTAFLRVRGSALPSARVNLLLIVVDGVGMDSSSARSFLGRFAAGCGLEVISGVVRWRLACAGAAIHARVLCGLRMSGDYAMCCNGCICHKVDGGACGGDSRLPTFVCACVVAPSHAVVVFARSVVVECHTFRLVMQAPRVCGVVVNNILLTSLKL